MYLMVSLSNRGEVCLEKKEAQVLELIPRTAEQAAGRAGWSGWNTVLDLTIHYLERP